MGLIGEAEQPGTQASDLETSVVGAGEPVTVVAHGFGSDLAGARLLAAGVPGTRLLYAARGHGRSPSGDQPITHEVLADDLDRVGERATRAIGVSMGASSVLHLLARDPDRFDRVVLQLLPGRGNGHPEELAAALESRDQRTVEELVRRELPVGLDLPDYVRLRTRTLLAAAGLPAFVRSLRSGPALPPTAALAAVRARVLVVAHEGDPVHPVSAAHEVLACLPAAELVVFDRPLLLERARLRALTQDFLSAT